MSIEQVKNTVSKIDNYVTSILDISELFIDHSILQHTRTAWTKIGKSKISELNKQISNINGDTLNEAGLTDEFLKFKTDIIDFLSKNLKKYAERILDCIITFLASLACAIPEIRLIVEILKELMSFIKNILN